jgi:hypothetical protein
MVLVAYAGPESPAAALCNIGICHISVNKMSVYVAKYRAWGHEYVITSLLENAVILETIKKEGSFRWRLPSPTLMQRPRAMSVWEAP